MKTLDKNARTQIENEILTSICQRPDFFDLYPLKPSMFFHEGARQIFERMMDLHGANLPITPLSLLDIIELPSVISQLFTDPCFDVYPHFQKACEILEEDYVRTRINRLTDQCGDSLEYYKQIDQLYKLRESSLVVNFDQELQKYENEYKASKTRAEQGGLGIVHEYAKLADKVPMLPSELIVVGARTSVGKTAFSLNLAVQAAIYGQKTLFVSMEMGRKQIFDRIFSQLLNEDSYKLKYGKVDFELIRQEAIAIKNNFFFVEAPNATTDLVRTLASKKNYDMIVVDYLQLLKDQPIKYENENQRLGKVTSALKAIALQNKCVVLAPAQLNRDSEKNSRRPNLSDLRDSGNIEQDADVVLLLHRESRESTLTDLIVAKNRNGSLGDINFMFNPAKNIFLELKSERVQVIPQKPAQASWHD